MNQLPANTNRSFRISRFRLGRILYASRRMVTSIVLLLFALFWLVSFTAVQNWTVQRVTDYLRDLLKTEVRIGQVRMDLFNRLVLEGLYVEDLKGDTLLYARKLKVNFSLSPWNVFRGRYEIDEISLENTRFYLRRDTGERDFNIQFIVDAFSKPRKEPRPASEPIDLNVNDVYLSDVYFSKNDQVKGQVLNAYVEDGIIHLNNMDLPGNHVDVRSVELKNPLIRIEELPAHPLPNNPAAKKSDKQTSPPDTAKPLLLTVQHFLLDNGHFVMHNYDRSPVKTEPKEILDYNHLDVFNINIDIDNFKFHQELFSGKVRNIAFQDISGFVLNKLSSNEVLVSPRFVQLNGCKLVTPVSDIGDTLVLRYGTYADFRDYNDKVLMEGRFRNSRVALSDVMVFAPGLEDVPLFKRNEKEVFQLDGVIRGKVNSLQGKNLHIGMKNKNLDIRCNFSSRNFAVRNEEVLNLRVDKLSTDIQTVKSLVPDLKGVNNIDKLGRLTFKGQFDGFFADFVADGDLQTDLGGLGVDMKLDVTRGLRAASYSGKMSLDNFQLGQWLNIKELEGVTLSTEVRDGSGLQANTANAHVKAVVNEARYQGYPYRNLTVDGNIKRNLFDGVIAINDPGVHLEFNGTIDYLADLPVFDFQSRIYRWDLKATHFTDLDYVLESSLDFNLKGNKLDNIEGKALAPFIRLVRTSTGEVYQIAPLKIESSRTPDSIRQLVVRSEVLNADIKGYYSPDEIYPAIVELLHRQHPGLAAKIGIPHARFEVPGQDFSFDIRLSDAKNLLHLADTQFHVLKGLHLQGRCNTFDDQLQFDLDVTRLTHGNVGMDDIAAKWKDQQEEGEASLAIFKLQVNDMDFAPINTAYFLRRDTVEFLITSANFYSVFDNLNLNGRLSLQDSLFRISFLSSDLTILKDKWEIAEGNFLLFGKNYIETNDFDLHCKERRMLMQSITDGKGLSLQLINFDLHYLDQVWDYDELTFGGRYTITLDIGNLFEMKDLGVSAYMDTVWINKRNFGRLALNASMSDLRHPLLTETVIENEPLDERLTVKGIYMPPNAAPNLELTDPAYLEKCVQPEYYDVDVKLSHYPLKIAEYFIGDGISNTTGSIDALLTLNGKTTGRPNIGGYATVHKAATTINYLQTRYFIDNQLVRINNNLFDATGAILRDTLNNEATVFGGITHNQLHDFGLNVAVKSPKILALNTTKKDNPTFYGQGLGAVDVRFTGTFKKTDININAVAGRGTRLSIPIQAGQDTAANSFVTFKLRKDEEAEAAARESVREIRGLSLEMELTVNEEAEVQLIFDEQAGDVIKGKGRGNIQILVPRGSNMSMFGNYEIEKGDYLFTLYNFVNKPFSVKRGGTIQWNGDPLDAQIVLDAEYKGISTSPYNLIANLVDQTGGVGADEARRAVPVDVTLFLRNKLMKPDIQFDISFPNLQVGEVKTYIDQQMRILHQDQNELNRQVFGLIVAGTFLPTNQAGFNLSVTSTGFNTVTEMLSNQFSLLISEFLTGVIKQGDFISGVDFDVNYIYDTGVFRNSNNLSLRPSSEIELRPRVNLLNDRLTINYAYVWGDGSLATGPAASNTYNNHDVTAELSLTDDKRLKVKIYYRKDQNFDGSPRQRAGVGFIYRREFDRLFGGKTRVVN